MSVQVSEKVVDIFRSSRIPIPFANVKTEESFVGVFLGLLDEAGEVGIEVFD